jgi:hypothetical protein
MGNFGSNQRAKLIKLKGLEDTNTKSELIQIQKEIWRLVDKRDSREYKINLMTKKIEYTKIKLKNLRAECGKFESPGLDTLSIEGLKEELQQQKMKNTELEQLEEASITQRRRKIEYLKQKNSQLEERCYRASKATKMQPKIS